MNDPFDGGMHLPDIFVMKPLFHAGERLAVRLHGLPSHCDVGGRVAGSNASDLDRRSTPRACALRP